MKRVGFAQVLLLLTAIGAGTGVVRASSDELYYPATQCHPFRGSQWEGGGSDGFAFVPEKGGWYNFDEGDAQDHG